MHHHAGGLVDDHQVVILVDYVQGNVLGLDGVVVVGAVEHQRHHIPGLDAVTALDGNVVYVYEAGLCRGLNTVARGAGQMDEEKLVYPEQLLPAVGRYAEVFVERVGVLLGGIVVGCLCGRGRPCIAQRRGHVSLFGLRRPLTLRHSPLLR